MRAAVLQEPDGRNLAVEELPDPSPAPDELLLRVEACGICGSDLHLAQALPLPGVVLGHELCGTVVGAGAEVQGWSDGDRAATLSLATCGACAACLSGRPRKCATAAMVGIERPGGYAEYLTIPARDAWRLPDALDHRHGALVEPLAVALHAVRRGRLLPGEDALVLGAGPVGAAVALWLRTLGAREVVVSDPLPARRDLAAALGAGVVVDPTAEDVASVFERATGHAPRLVFECVGVPGLIQQAVELAGVDARVVIAGVCFGPDQIVPLDAMQKELDLLTAFYYTASDYDTTISLMAAGRIDPLPMVTDEISLDETPDRFAQMQHPSPDRPLTDCKVLIRP